MATNFNLKIKPRPIESLIPHARNSRTHTAEQIEQIVASIEEFGWTNPVLIDEADGIIAGHGRVLAARQLGLAEVPCISLAGLSELQKRAYVIADNKLALNAGWDAELLTIEFDALKEAGFEVDLIGFTDADLEALRPKAPEVDVEPPKGAAEHTCPNCGYVWTGTPSVSS